MRKGLWKLKRSELTPEELAWVRKVDADKARKRRRLKSDIINAQRRERCKTDEEYRNRLNQRNFAWRKRNWAKVYAQRKASGECRRGAIRWYHNRGKYNIQHVLKERMRRRIRRALQNTGKSAFASAVQLCGCTPHELMLHLQSKFQEGMHWNNYGKWHIDHIRPCASFDFTDPEQQRQCFHYTNLQPLWAAENIRKGAKLITVQPLNTFP